MAVAARKPESYRSNASATRVYVDSRVYYSSAAPKLEPEERESPEEVYVPSPAQRTRPAQTTRAAARTKSKVSPAAVFFKKAAVLLSICCIAAACIAVLMRYSLIAQEYDAVNGLKSNIEQCKIDLDELKVKLSSAVSIEEARDAADAAGMRYPSAEQIVRVGGD